MEPPAPLDLRAAPCGAVREDAPEEAAPEGGGTPPVRDALADLARRALLIAVGAALAVAGFVVIPPTPVHAAALAGACWLAPWAWLVAIEGLGAGWRFRAMFLAGMLTAAGGLAWLWTLFGPLALLLWGLLAFYAGLWGVAIGPQTSPSRLVRLVWPGIAWCGIEWFRGELAPLRFGWLVLGQAQAGWGGAALLPWVGVYGLGGVMVAWGAAARWAWRARGHPARRRAATLLLAAWVGALWPVGGWGGARAGGGGAAVPLAEVELWQFAPDDDPFESPALAARLADTGDARHPEGSGAAGRGRGRSARGRAETPPPARGDRASRPAAARMAADAEPAAASPPDLIVWPEYSFFQDPDAPEGTWVATALRRVAALARAGAIVGAIDVPAGRTREQAYHNTAFYIGPDGAERGRAGKNQPIQLLRDGLPAPEVTVVEVPELIGPSGEALRLGVAICYDGAYQQFARRLAARGADALIFPVFNAGAWGPVQHHQHAQLFRVRAMETRRALAVAAFSGPTFFVAPDGRVTAGPAPWGEAAIVRGTLAAPGWGGGKTPLVLAGWLAGPACLLLTLAAPPVLLSRRRRA